LNILYKIILHDSRNFHTKLDVVHLIKKRWLYREIGGIHARGALAIGEKINTTVRIITQKPCAKSINLALHQFWQLPGFLSRPPARRMNRKFFLSIIGLSSFANKKSMANTAKQPETFYFKDDGRIPNNKLPLLVYRKALTGFNASKIQKHFAANNWTNSWDNGVYSFHHYHSTSHEALAVYSGAALLHLGGENGEKVNVEAGDVIVIPAGVGHKNLGANNDFGVVGAYPDGRDWDLLKGEPGERPKADQNIAALPIPEEDPLLGKVGGLTQIWNS
jgi:uncharacterized protein YjlB